MFATHFFENMILNTFRDMTAVGIGNLFVGLFVTSPTDTGSAGLEVAYTGYARQPVSFTIPYEESGGIGIRNTTDMIWAAAPADVGIVRYVGVFDTQTIGAGNMLLYGELNIPLDVRAGQQPSIYEGEMLYFALGAYSVRLKTDMLNVLRGQNLNGFNPFMALFDGDPEGAGVELSGGAYARPALTFGAPAIQVGGHTLISNTSVARFPMPTTPWGNWAYQGIMDAPTGGNLLVSSINPRPEVIQRGYVPVVPVANARVSLH